MRCPSCQQEVVLARICPYCGARVRPPSGGWREEAPRQDVPPGATAEAPLSGGVRGRFRGPLGSASGWRGRKGPGIGISPVLLLRFLLDPTVAAWKKWLLAALALYFFSPIDLVPGALVPILGWLDDLAVLTVAWRFLTEELRRYGESKGLA